jgi:hypothetical protein
MTTWFLAIMCFVVIPLKFIHTLIKKSIEDIKDPDFIRKWGVLFWNLKLRNKHDASFYFIFILRRFFYVVISLVLVDYSQFQIIVLFVMNILMTIYQGSNMPLNTRYSNLIELWNEFWIQMATLNLMLFTDFVLTFENKYMYGWSFIVIMMM